MLNKNKNTIKEDFRILVSIIIYMAKAKEGYFKFDDLYYTLYSSYSADLYSSNKKKLEKILEKYNDIFHITNDITSYMDKNDDLQNFEKLSEEEKRTYTTIFYSLHLRRCEEENTYKCKPLKEEQLGFLIKYLENQYSQANENDRTTMTLVINFIAIIITAFVTYIVSN